MLTAPHPLPLYLCATPRRKPACDGLAVRQVTSRIEPAHEFWVCQSCGATWNTLGNPTARYEFRGAR